MDKPVFSPDFVRDLAENNPIGMLLTEDDFRAWFDLIWIKYKLRGYSNHKRAVTNWWSNVREGDIIQARERTRRLTEETAIANLERAAADFAPPTNVQNIFAKVSKCR